MTVSLPPPLIVVYFAREPLATLVSSFFLLEELLDETVDVGTWETPEVPVFVDAVVEPQPLKSEEPLKL